MKSHLWKHGPPWLGQEEENWPNQERSIPEITELGTFISSSSNNDTWTVLYRFSTIDTLQRVIAWCYRFIRNSQSKTSISGELSMSELQYAMHSIIKNHILRIGGHLKHSILTYNQKHPIVSDLTTETFCTALKRLLSQREYKLYFKFFLEPKKVSFYNFGILCSKLNRGLPQGSVLTREVSQLSGTDLILHEIYCKTRKSKRHVFFLYVC
ncbi:hypothetical protein ALC57_10503 [Trachymyrmex cornetzi]|uniref:Uncharacterized protein n=1 Tax=Trachymyrmex cornetzi TaxID=471704 RepID=A0A151J455_9HYME|nr:hypothetical protein ALC57_10503 [Trachymyrmex cornetzi]